MAVAVFVNTIRTNVRMNSCRSQYDDLHCQSTMSVVTLANRQPTPAKSMHGSL